jgi:hypothetical protein
MNFVKLKNNIELAEYSITDSIIKFGMDVNGVFKGIEYSYVQTPVKTALLNLIPEEYQQYFDVSIMQVNTAIPPHTDSNIMATINFYINTDNCITQFYSLKTNTPRTEQVENQTTGYLFSMHDLNTEDKFEAVSGELWLLNVSKPHSVQPLRNGPVNRVAFCLQSRKFTFEENVEMLQATGNL